MDFILPPNLKNVPAVYMIHFNEKWIYVGSSIDIRKRVRDWRCRLINPKFIKNKNLEQIYSEIESVRFEIIREYTTSRYIRSAETRLIGKHWDNPLLLNRCPDAESPKNLRPYNGQKPKIKHVPRESFFKPVAKFDMLGNYIESFPNISSAALSIGCQSRVLNNLFKGNGKSVKGFIVKLIDKDGSFIEPPIKKIKSRVGSKNKIKPWRKFYQIDSMGNIVDTFYNLRDASKATGADSRNIWKVLEKKPKYKSVKGYSFKYA